MNVSNMKVTQDRILTLNLADKNRGIDYKVTRFPDGQQSITLLQIDRLQPVQNLTVKISSRLKSFVDLELIICATQALKEIGVSKIALYIPYCLGNF